MKISNDWILKEADRVVSECASRDPDRIAEVLNIYISERDFKKQLGVYYSVIGKPFIFIKAGLDLVRRKTVLLHEIGHHILHNEILKDGAGILDNDLFDMQNKLEYEANIFAAQISLPDEEFLELINYGYNVEQLAQAFNTDPNLVALKIDILNKKGYKFNKQNFEWRFLN